MTKRVICDSMGKKFNKLEHKVELEYEKKGVSKETAMKWGAATAAKVFREKKAKKEREAYA